MKGGHTAVKVGPDMTFTYCPRCGHALEQRECFGRIRPACPACRFVHFANPRVAVVIFLHHANRVLLVKRGVPPEKGRWALPAGYIDLGEPPEEAAIREMQEETGLEVSIEGLLDLGYNPVSQAIVITYRARLLGGEPMAGDDAAEARWFGTEELPDLAFDSTRKAIGAWIRTPPADL
nr:NUDIX hydrolase [uncultured Holophaga sp.]